MIDLVQLHKLKINKEYWDALISGAMPFTVRRDDRGFQKGDKIKFFKYDPTPHKSGEFYDQSYFKRESQYQKKRTATQEDGVYWTGMITYVLSGGQYGIEPGYVVLGLKPCDESKEMKNEKELKNKKFENAKNARDIMPIIDHPFEEDEIWIDEIFTK